MENRPHPKNGGTNQNRGTNPWVARLDRTAADLNIVLLVVAIGLAMLDLTCFLAFRMREALPSPARVESIAPVAARPVVAQGPMPAATQAQPVTALPSQSVAVLAPTKPSAAVTGW
jgi:hypothetical protein